MKSYEDNKKPNRKKDYKKDKKNHFFDEDRFIQNKINKNFKYKKKYLSEDDEDEDLRDWESYK